MSLKAGMPPQSLSREEPLSPATPLSPFTEFEQPSSPPVAQSLRSPVLSGREPLNGPSRMAGRESSNGPSQRRAASEHSNRGPLWATAVSINTARMDGQMNARPVARTRSLSREQPRSGSSMAKQDGQVAVESGLSLSEARRSSRRLVPTTATAAESIAPATSAAVTAVMLRSASPKSYLRQASCSPVSTSRTASPATVVQTASPLPLPAPRTVVPTSVFSPVVTMTCQVGSARTPSSPARTCGQPAVASAPVAMQGAQECTTRVLRH